MWVLILGSRFCESFKNSDFFFPNVNAQVTMSRVKEGNTGTVSRNWDSASTRHWNWRYSGNIVHWKQQPRVRSCWMYHLNWRRSSRRGNSYPQPLMCALCIRCDSHQDHLESLSALRRQTSPTEPWPRWAGGSLIIGISSKFPSDADAAGLGMTHGGPVLHTQLVWPRALT